MSTTTVETSIPPTQAPTSPSQAAAKAEEKDDGREYVVLVEVSGVWQKVASVEATSAQQAVRKAAELPGTSFLSQDKPTTLVAVPARSWNPITVSVKVETSIVLS